MPVNKSAYDQLRNELDPKNVVIVAVSKTKTVESILALYKLGHRDFGENYVQELLQKSDQLPTDIKWHFIGHLQSNKVKFLAPFISLIHSVDSLKLLKEISKHGIRLNRVIDCLLQVHIATEETKFGLDAMELEEILEVYNFGQLPGIRIRGMMGMASFSDDKTLVRSEFRGLKEIFDQVSKRIISPGSFNILSMGMSNDYLIAIEEGSNLVRIGSLLFGSRSQER